VWWTEGSCARGRGLGSRLAAGALALLGCVAIPLAGCADEDGAAIERMLRATDAGDWHWAAHLAARTGLPELRAYVRWRELLEAQERPPFTAYAAFLRGAPDWPSLGTVQARGEEAMDAAVPFAERTAFFAGRAPRTRQGRILRAEALIAADRTDEAAVLLREAWVGDEFGREEEQLFLERFGGRLTARDHAARLDRLLWDGRVDQARRMLPRVGATERAAAGARLKLQLADPGVEAALAALTPEARSDAGVAFDRLRWRRKHGSEAGVREILLRPPQELRRPELWWRQQEAAIRAALADRSFKLAYGLASASRQTSGVPFADAEWLSGWLALRFTDRPEAARRHFERLWPAVTTPISKGRAGYWSGRAAAAVGAAGEAALWFGRAADHPTSYYGQLAALELGLDPGSRAAAARAATPAAREALRRRAPAELGGLFCRLGHARHAHPFFRHLGFEAAGDPDGLAAVVELAQACGRADLSLAATRGAAANGTHLARESYPLPRYPGFRDRGGVAEPALVLAVSRQESLFDPTAVSSAGAMGLMQLMPGTAQSVSRDLGEAYSRGRLVREPDYNIRLGARYLGQQLARFGDEPALALAAYNAGPRRVTQWLELHGDPRGGDPHRLLDWIELIPFAETRNYVQRVLEGRGMYRIALGQPALPGTRSAARESPAAPRAKPAS
jgi:soluble lytic murein transglycosylase